MEENRRPQQESDDFPQREHFPMTNHHQTHACFDMQWMNENHSPTSDVKVIKLKPCSLNIVLHILKELECALPIIPHLEAYYFIYHLQMFILGGYALPMLNTHIMVDDFGVQIF